MKLFALATPHRETDSLLSFSVTPTHTMDRTYRPDSTDSRTLRLLVALDGDEWIEITGCPTARGDAAFTRRVETLDRRWENASRARASLPDSVTGVVRTPIQGGRRIEAIHAVQKALPDISLGVARDVVSLLRFHRARR